MTFLKKLKTLDADFLRFYKEVKLENAAPFFPNFKLVLFETLRTNLQQHKNLILLECLWKRELRVCCSDSKDTNNQPAFIALSLL